MERLAAHTKQKTGDLSIVLLVTILVLFGIVMIFSASYYYAIGEWGDAYHYLKRQIVWVIGGAIGMWITARIDYHFWLRLWIIVPVICLILLLLIFTPLGITVNGATRWLGKEGFPITVMPGEFAKVGVILYITGHFSKKPKSATDWWKGIVPVLLVAGVYFALIMKQPNMSTAFTVVLIAGGMLLVAGIQWKHVGVLAALGAAAAVIFVFSDREGYRYGRLLSFLDPFADALGDGWQVVQSLLALGTGGLTGLGLGNSVQKNLYLPEAQNDFILAIIGEELGFIGILALVLVYVLLVWRGCHVAMNARDYTGIMLASGSTMMVGLQVVINIAVVTSSMPPTGIILPFVSYGGNALLIFMGAMGILLNISKSAEL